MALFFAIRQGKRRQFWLPPFASTYWLLFNSMCGLTSAPQADQRSMFLEIFRVSVSFWLLFPLSLPVQQYPAADSHSEAEQDESEISKDRPWVPGKQADHAPVGSVPAAI